MVLRPGRYWLWRGNGQIVEVAAIVIELFRPCLFERLFLGR